MALGKSFSPSQPGSAPAPPVVAAHAQWREGPGGGGRRPSGFALTPAPAGGHSWGLGAACCREDPARQTEPESLRRQLPGERRRFSASRRHGFRSDWSRGPSFPTRADAASPPRPASSGERSRLAFSATSPRTRSIYSRGGRRSGVGARASRVGGCSAAERERGRERAQQGAHVPRGARRPTARTRLLSGRDSSNLLPRNSPEARRCRGERGDVREAASGSRFRRRMFGGAAAVPCPPHRPSPPPQLLRPHRDKRGGRTSWRETRARRRPPAQAAMTRRSRQP